MRGGALGDDDVARSTAAELATSADRGATRMALELFALLPTELLREITLHVLSGGGTGDGWKLRTTGWRAACKRSHELVAAVLALQHVEFAGVLGYQAFVGYTALKSVTLRGTQLRHIAAMAFYNVTTLEKVVLPPTLLAIGERAFYGCDSLTDIVLPEGLQYIEHHAFSWCSALSSIVLPEGLKALHDSVFLESGLTSITLPSSLLFISDFAFSMCRLERIEFNKPSSLRHLNSFAFHANVTLAGTVELPESLQSIGSNVFENCHCEIIRVPSGLARRYDMDRALDCMATVVRY